MRTEGGKGEGTRERERERQIERKREGPLTFINFISLTRMLVKPSDNKSQ